VPVEELASGIIGFVIDGGKREEEPTQPKPTAKTPKGRRSTG
jgi:hypothetical protein